MVLASRSSYFKTLFFGDFKEKNEKRIAMEADPEPFQRMLNILYDPFCTNYDFFKCGPNFADVFWKEGVSLWELLERYDVQLGLKFFEKNLNKYCCPENSAVYKNKWEANRYVNPEMVSTCPHCVLRKIFTMQHGIDLDVSSFDWSSIKTAIDTAHEKKIMIEADILTELIRTVMRNGVF